MPVSGRHRPRTVVSALLAVAGLGLALAAPASFAQAPKIDLAASAPAEEPADLGGLLGWIHEGTYVAPSLLYRIAIPIVPGEGASVADTPSVVTFQAPRTHVSVGAFPMDATLRWEDSTRGRKAFLAWFFGATVMPSVSERFPGARVSEEGRFLTKLEDGALVAFCTLPGGTAFAESVPGGPDAAAQIDARRGTLLWIHGETIFVISTELPERALDGPGSLTAEEENKRLQDRLLELRRRITYLRQEPAA